MSDRVSRLVQEVLGRPALRGLRSAKLWVQQRLGLAFYHPVQVRRRVELHGDPDYGGWRVCPEGIDADSIVYDIGVGEDISFAISLIEKYRLRVWAFDPTPRSILWFGQQERPPQLVFEPCGIAEVDGDATFYLPDNRDWVSGTLLPMAHHGGGAMRVPVKRLQTLMAERGHDRVDILKLDVEGAEYGVLRDLLSCALDIHQILVEFHHSQDCTAARAAISDLNGHGYQLFAVNHGTDFSFIRIQEPERRS